MTPPPSSLFKYCPPERVDILRSGKIRFTQAAELNDPFEINARPDYNQAPASAADFLRRHTQDVRSLIAKHWGILSMTSRGSSLQMWAHYAAGHRGFLLEFDTTDQFFNPIGRNGGFLGPFPVSYGAEPPTCDVTELTAFLHKGMDWAPEDEWRMFNSDVDHIEKWGNIYLYSLPATAIKAIYLGSLATQEQTTDWIRYISAHSNHGHVKIFGSELQRESHSIRHFQIAGPRTSRLPSNVKGPWREPQSTKSPDSK